MRGHSFKETAEVKTQEVVTEKPLTPDVPDVKVEIIEPVVSVERQLENHKSELIV